MGNTGKAITVEIINTLLKDAEIEMTEGGMVITKVKIIR
jgi:hypothetical protein